jgi:hypothetical protein
LALTLDKEALFSVDEYTANQITLISITVELERIGQEVVDVDYTTI